MNIVVAIAAYAYHAAVPKSGYVVEEWSEVPDPVTPCEARASAGELPPGELSDVSVGMLTHEPISMRDSLATYEANGFFDVIPEFIVYVNARTPEIEAELKPYVDKYGTTKFRVMGDKNNYGILRGIAWMVGNATYGHFMLLERDFQLIEPALCVHEQLSAGLELIKANTAQVVRYRHRRRSGRPNWAIRCALAVCRFRAHVGCVRMNAFTAFHVRTPNLSLFSHSLSLSLSLFLPSWRRMFKGKEETVRSGCSGLRAQSRSILTLGHCQTRAHSSSYDACAVTEHSNTVAQPRCKKGNQRNRRRHILTLSWACTHNFVLLLHPLLLCRPLIPRRVSRT